MELGIGLYRHLLTAENFRFARQIGCTAVVAHLVDYYRQPAPAQSADNQPVDRPEGGWGITEKSPRPWTTAELIALRNSVEAEGLRLHAIENFDPGFWYDVLLDGPRRAEQMEVLKGIVRSVGEARAARPGWSTSRRCTRGSRTSVPARRTRWSSALEPSRR